MDRMQQNNINKLEVQNEENEEAEQVLKLIPEYGILDILDIQQFLKLSRDHFGTIWCRTERAVLLDFLILRFVSAGAFGKLYLVHYKARNTYHAMKVMKKSHIIKKKQLQHLINEKYILQRINFPFVTHLEFCFKDNSYVYFITPFYYGEELFQVIRKMQKFEEHLSRFVAAQVVLALEYLHNLDIIYRDLKPENILFDHTGYIKLIDFGFSKIVSHRTYTMCGTPEYLAPEIIRNRGYGKAVDWWAFGILLYEMGTGSTPFKSKYNNVKSLFKTDYGTSYIMPPLFSYDLKDLVKNMLQVDTSRRFGNLKNGIDDIKSHRWFRPILWLSLLNRCLESPYTPDVRHLHNIGSHHSIVLSESEQNEFSKKFEDF